MNEKETAIFIAEIRKDILYIKERLDDKCKLYDRHLEEAPSRQEKMGKLEEKMSLVWVLFILVITAVIGAYFKR